MIPCAVCGIGCIMAAFVVVRNVREQIIKTKTQGDAMSNIQDAIRAKVARLSDEMLSDLFTASFEGTVSGRSSNVSIPNFECEVKRVAADTRPTVEVSVFEMADSSSKDEVCQKDAKGKIVKVAKEIAAISVKLPDDAMAAFQLEDCLNLSATSYMLVYRLV